MAYQLNNCGNLKQRCENYLQFLKNDEIKTKKGQSLRSTRPVIGACCKISNNKICYNFGYVHEIAFCTAVPNLSQIGQP